MGRSDYSLTSDRGARAVEVGLATADWYHSDLPRKRMKELMKRTDQPAIRDTVIWLGLMAVAAAIAVALWPSWWSAPFWLIYGLLYASGSDSRWHEAGHGTAFRTDWMNTVVHQIASFCLLRNPVLMRWSHARHHTDTIIVGRDPEIVAMRPPDLLKFAGLFFGLETILSFFRAFRHAFVGLNEEEESFIPEAERHKVRQVALIWIAIFAGTLAVALVTSSVLPFMLLFGPVIFGSWHYVAVGFLQHAGMAEDVLDHRLNSRTVLMNPLSRFIYWNMNYHVEHHMFPMVPYHRLPDLHEAIRGDLPPPDRSVLAALGDVWHAFRMQRRDPGFRVEKRLPDGARPYRYDLHADALGRSTG
jgi:fatty acid desaturase